MAPFWLRGSQGELLLMTWGVYGRSVPPQDWVLHLPALFEEMNRCRPMVAQQARALAKAGYAVVVPDLSGTGDSAGELAGVNWQHWIDDLVSVVQWLRSQGARRVSLWSVRGGSLLIGPLCAVGKLVPQRIVAWQPITEGASLLRQFLRVRIAQAMSEGVKLSVAELQLRIERGETVEVAGYPLTADVTAGLQAAVLDLPDTVEGSFFFELSSTTSLSLGLQRFIDQRVGRLSNVMASIVAGEPFWATQEIAMAPALLEQTSGVFGEVQGSPAECQGLIESVLAVPRADGREVALTFIGEGETLAAVAHAGAAQADCGVVIIVGGPQYRIGSHRQFVSIARAIAEAGYPVLRFDYRGMGDASGLPVGFLNCSQDIRAATDALLAVFPSLQRVVLWGLCDAATAAALYAPSDARVERLILINPWVRSEAGEAKAYLKHYYLNRIASRSFWRKLFNGEVQMGKSVKSLFEKVGRSVRARSSHGHESETSRLGSSAQHADTYWGIARSGDLPAAVRSALSAYGGESMLLMSENDLTAAEFRDAFAAELGRVGERGSLFAVSEVVTGADHTFSRAEWRREVVQASIGWIRG